MASQTPGSSPLMAVNHVFLVLPILQIIAFPRQSFSVWAPTSVDQSVECLAIQILSHLEMEIPLLMKYSSHQEQSMVCFNSRCALISILFLHLFQEKQTWSSQDEGV